MESNVSKIELETDTQNGTELNHIDFDGAYQLATNDVVQGDDSVNKKNRLGFLRHAFLWFQKWSFVVYCAVFHMFLSWAIYRSWHRVSRDALMHS